MEIVTVSPTGQIDLPAAVRDALQLAAGTKLLVDVRGQEIVLSREPAWKRLRGAASGMDLVGEFARFKRQENAVEEAGT